MGITKSEKRLIDWLRRHFTILTLAAVTLLSLLLRLSCLNIVSGDASFHLLPWFDKIKAAGGLMALREQVGDYNLTYQTIIALLTYLPIRPLYAYKLLSCAFDYALAVVMAALCYYLAPRRKTESAVLGYTLVVLSPLVWLNSAAWAQCDVIFSFFALSALVLLCRDRIAGAFVCLGLAFAFKLQAVFALPFFLLAWLLKKNWSLVNLLWIPAVLLLTALPAIAVGRSPADAFTIYFHQVSEYPRLFLNYPSFWVLVDGLCQQGLYPALQGAAICLTMGVLLVWAWICLQRKVLPTGQNLLALFFILNYTCVLFLPAMHERYGFLYEIAAIALAVTDRKSFGLLAALTGLSLVTYCTFLFGWQAIGMSYLAVANCVVYLLYSRHILRSLDRECPA